VRVFDRRQIMALDNIDIQDTVREVYESAVCMGRKALSAMGVEENEIAEIEREYRRRDIDRLDIQISSGDLHAGNETVFRPRG
jgi:hypothetical protein